MTPVLNRGPSTRAIGNFSRTILPLIAAAALIGTMALPQAARAGDVPTFAVDASWPKPLPNNWIIGQVGGITADSKGHIWVIHRPRSADRHDIAGGCGQAARGERVSADQEISHPIRHARP
jgi:hypothetical protein